jgi:hypothetical protein
VSVSTVFARLPLRMLPAPARPHDQPSASSVSPLDPQTGYAAFLSNCGDPGETGRAVEQCRQQVAAGETRALALLGALLLTQSGGEAKAEAEAVLRHGAVLLENRCRSLLAALLLERGTVGEAAELIERLRATGDEYVRAYAEALAEEYDL